jgi:hypothetical protein
MALRFASKGIAITSNGLTIAHGLGTTPDEYWVVARTATGVFVPHASSPDATNMYVSTGAGTVTGDVFAVVSHSIIR